MQSRKLCLRPTRPAPDNELGISPLNEAWLMWGLLFGSIGLGYFMYGKKQSAVVPLICGLMLMIFPYFVSSTLWLVVIGIVLIALPYFVRI